MNVITLSKRKFENLEPLKLERGIYCTESQVYKMNYKGNEKVIKKLFHREGDAFANKLYTFEMLSYNKKYLPESFVIPDAQISVSGEIQGFAIPYVEGINLATLLNDENISFDEKKYYLIKVGEILNQLKAIRSYTPLKDIYIGDLYSSNFIVKPNNRTLAVIDLDSCKIKGNTSFVSRYLDKDKIIKYVKNKYVLANNENKIGEYVVDENTDLYCYSMMILTSLYGLGVDRFTSSGFYEYLNYLEQIGMSHNLVQIFRDLISNKDNTNPCTYLDGLDETMWRRAKREVYDKTKEKILKI